MSGFLAVNSLVSACIRIMSPLFTVAMVRVVCAMEGTAPKRVAAPRRAPRTCFTVSSLIDVEHMPTPCNYVHIECRPCQGSESRLCTERGRRRCDAVPIPQPLPVASPAREMERPCGSLRLENGAGRCLVGDQPVE